MKWLFKGNWFIMQLDYDKFNYIVQNLDLLLLSKFVDEIPEDVKKFVYIDRRRNIIAVPRGLTPRFARELGIENDVAYRDDIEIDIPNDLKNILRKYQIDVVYETLKQLRMCGAATIILPPAGGKTFLCGPFCKLIPHRKVFYVTMTRDLVRQAAERIKQFGFDVGVVESDTPNFDYEVICCTAKTLFNALTTFYKHLYQKEVELESPGGEAVPLSKETKIELARTYINDADLVLLDECYSPDTLILLEDGGVITIEELVNYFQLHNRFPKRVYIGGKVRGGSFRPVLQLYLIKTAYSMLLTNENHLHVVIAHKEFDGKMWYIPDPKHDLVLKRSCELKPNDELLVLNEIPHVTYPEYKDLHPKLAYLYALLTIYLHEEKWKGKNYVILCVKSKKYKDIADPEELTELEHSQGIDRVSRIEKFIYYIQSISRDYLGYEIPIEIKRYAHRVLVRVHVTPQVFTAFESLGLPLKRRDVPYQMFYTPLEFIKAYLTATLPYYLFSFYCRPPYIIYGTRIEEWWMIMKKWQHLWMKFGIVPQVELALSPSLRYLLGSICIKDIDVPRLLELFKPWEDPFIKDLFPDYVHKFLKLKKFVEDPENKHWLRHYYMMRRVRIGNKVYRIGTIVWIRVYPIRGPEPVYFYDIETDSHFFVAEGHVTHNCHHVPANTFVFIVASNLNSTRIGLTATPYRESDKKELMIFMFSGDPISKIVTYDELVYEGFAVPVIIIRYVREPSEKVLSEIYDILDSAKSKRLAYHYIKKYLLYRDVERIRDILVIARELPTPWFMLCSEIKQTELMFNLVKKYVFDEVAYVTSRVDDKTREYVFSAIRSGLIKGLIATPLAQEGLNMEPLKAIILTFPGKSRTTILQAIGRGTRPYIDKKFVLVIDIVDQVPILNKQGEKRKSFYETTPGWYVVDAYSLDEVLEIIDKVKEYGVESLKLFE